MAIAARAAFESSREDEQAVAVGTLGTDHVVDVLRYKLEHAAHLTPRRGHCSQESTQERGHRGKEPLQTSPKGRLLTPLPSGGVGGGPLEELGVSPSGPVEQHSLRLGISPERDIIVMGYHEQMVGKRPSTAGRTIDRKAHRRKSTIWLRQRVDGPEQFVQLPRPSHLVGIIILVIAQANKKLPIIHHTIDDTPPEQLLVGSKFPLLWEGAGGGHLYLIRSTIFRLLVAMQLIERSNERLMQASHLAELGIGYLIDGAHIIRSSLFLERCEGTLGMNHRMEAVVRIVKENQRGIVAGQLSRKEHPQRVGSTGYSFRIRQHPIAHHLRLGPIDLIVNRYLHVSYRLP